MRTALSLPIFFFALPVQAATYCCEISGSTICDEGVPPRCVGKQYRELDSRGVTVRIFEAPLTPEQKAKRDAELAKKKADEEAAAAEERANRKLLSAYDSVGDIDATRDRVIDDHMKSLQQAQDKLNEALAKKQTIDNEAEFYKKRPMPETLKIQIKNVTKEILAQEKNVAERKAEIDADKIRFAQERIRYLLLTSRQPGAAPILTPAPTPAATR